MLFLFVIMSIINITKTIDLIVELINFNDFLKKYINLILANTFQKIVNKKVVDARLEHSTGKRVHWEMTG